MFYKNVINCAVGMGIYPWRCTYIVMKYLTILAILMVLGLSGTTLAENTMIDCVTFQEKISNFSLDESHRVVNFNSIDECDHHLFPTGLVTIQFR